MISARPYTNLEAVKDILGKLVEHIHFKLLLANISIFLAWAFDGDTTILKTIFTLIIIDTISGVWAVLKIEGWKGFKSREFVVAPVKLVVFITLMYVARTVDKSFPIHWAAPIMDTFLVTTEAKSILENFGKLGFPVPLVLLSKLKSLNEKKE